MTEYYACKNCGKRLGFNRNEYYHETTVTTTCNNPEPDFEKLIKGEAEVQQ